MHPRETKHKFIELRARDWSLRKIGNELGVDKATLVRWNRDFATPFTTSGKWNWRSYRTNSPGSKAERFLARPNFCRSQPAIRFTGVTL
jgi:hypothetical protein